MAIPSKKDAPKVEDFIQGATATKAETAKAKDKKPEGPQSKYLLAIEKTLRDQIKIEAIQHGVNMGEYICDILRQRKKLKG